MVEFVHSLAWAVAVDEAAKAITSRIREMRNFILPAKVAGWRSASPGFESVSKGSSCRNWKGARWLAPSSTLIDLYSHQSFTHSFEATPDARGTARHNHVTVGVEDLKRNCIGELVLVITYLDSPREPVCLCPYARSAKNEGLG